MSFCSVNSLVQRYVARALKFWKREKQDDFLNISQKKVWCQHIYKLLNFNLYRWEFEVDLYNAFTLKKNKVFKHKKKVYNNYV